MTSDDPSLPNDDDVRARHSKQNVEAERVDPPGGEMIVRLAGAEERIVKTYPAHPDTVFPHELLEFAIEAAREGYVRTASMGAAMNIMKRRLKERWTAEEGASGYVFKEHVHPLESYLRSGAGDEHVRRASPPVSREKSDVPAAAVAEARKRWDAAKTLGDADAMTRAANDLLRAVEADPASRADAAPPARTKGGRHPTSDVLAPRVVDSAMVREARDIGASSGVHAAQSVLASGDDGAVEAGAAVVSDDTEGDAVPRERAHFSSADDRRVDEEPSQQRGDVVPLAYTTKDNRLGGVEIETPGIEKWGPTNRRTARETLDRIVRVGQAIEKFGTPDQKKAWAAIKRIVLNDAQLATGGAAENDNDILRLDLSRMGAGSDPRVLDTRFVFFALVHEIFHSSDSSRKAAAHAIGLQGGSSTKSNDIGSPQWSFEVRHDKQVYDFLIKSGLIDPSTPIQKVAPYYAEHLKNPQVPVLEFPVPGYDGPLT